MLEYLRGNYTLSASLSDQARVFSREAHGGQKRLSGAPFFDHPAAVAGMVGELGLDDAGVAAAYLHDVLEDTDVGADEIECRFGAQTRRLVEAVTDLKRLDFASESEYERANLQRMLLAMAGDVRVVLIKVADRLDNLRTLEYLPPTRQRRFARETLFLFSPLADRLGLARFRWELEDLSFRYLEPESYRELAASVACRRAAREERLSALAAELEEVLKTADVAARVIGRAKNLYSIFRKMRSDGRAFQEVYDLMGLRVVTGDVADCYRVLDAIHGYAEPVTGRYKDYIARPKANLYQSIHTTVLWPGGEPVEAQIRTRSMDAVAEFGVAAHWRYKTGEGAVDGRDWGSEPALRFIRDAVMDGTVGSAAAEHLLADLVKEDVFVFTPQGDVKRLPRGATALDFAYQVHTDVGHHCARARINGRLEPIRTALTIGDVVEITTSLSQQPRRDWLEFVVSSSARHRIRAFLRRKDRDELVALGRTALVREVQRRGWQSRALLSAEALAAVAHDRRFPTAEHLLVLVGEGTLSAATVINALAPTPVDLAPVAVPELPDYAPYVVVSGAAGLELKIAGCCSPTPMALLAGYVTSRGTVSVHRRDCAVVRRPGARERVVEAGWRFAAEGEDAGVISFRVREAAALAAAIRYINDAGARVAAVVNNKVGGGLRCEVHLRLLNARLIKKLTRYVKAAGGTDVRYVAL